MKKISTLILVFGWVLFSYSQNVIQLEETRLNFDPTAEIVFEDYENGIVRVKEKFTTQFQSDAIGFMKKNFDVLRYIEAQNDISGNLIVTAKSSKGYMTAIFNEDGEMVKNYQQFKDIALPYAIRNQVYSQYIGWTITSNKYIASGLGDHIDKQKYNVKLQKGKEKTKMKIVPGASVSGVASIDK
ncbi:hypothetical protein [Christiangramia sediminis]|uniref:Uncharacterized protein n=1 Tax=Christiangramia sediminis TaxID=2881336 RepID=A0A9X1LGV1_9FLAO|nr:hypothetical protein [Christiangramia sediminis]MCB7480099.1 hypothetical protein [Christiangramia sediminis]